jgi:integrase
MAGVVKHTRGLESRSGRMKLKPGGKTHWREIVGGMALGYQRRHGGQGGRWIARSHIGGGKYRKAAIALSDDYEASNGTSILSYAEAAEHVRQQANSVNDPPLSVLTVGDAVADYLVWLKTHKASGRDAEVRAKKLILPMLGRVRLSDLTTRQLVNWRDAAAARPALLRSRAGAAQKYREPPKTTEEQRARRATVNRTWTILRAALNRAFNHGHVSSDLAWRRVTAFKNTTAVRPGYLTAEQANRLVNAADPDFRALVRGALETGCRFGELAAARVRDYEGGKLYIARSKSGKARSVVLSDAGAEFFASLTIGRAPDAAIFLRGGVVPWHKSDQARPMRAACAAARIKPALPFHSLRHTWASLAVMGGMPMLVVARNLGHADTRMVERHYGHLAASFIDQTVRAHAPDYGFEPVSGKVRPLR